VITTERHSQVIVVIVLEGYLLDSGDHNG
jgi:hypothetical protein